MDDEVAADAMTYFRWQHGLQTGRPQEDIFPWSEPQREPFDIWYHSRRLFNDTTPGDGLEMLDLGTGEKSTWIGEEALIDSCEILVSDRYVAVQHDSRYEATQSSRLVRIISQ